MQISQLQQAAQYIKEGNVVAFPTETVYGLGANALDPLAVARIFEMKQRPSFDPLIVHIADLADLALLTTAKDERVYKIADRFWPGPLTLILPKTNVVPEIVTSGLPTVGVRMPDNPYALELIRRAGCPIAAPSANKFGRISPTTAAHVRKQLPAVPFILDGGRTKVGIESTIVILNEKGFDIVRHGAILKEDIERLVPYSPSTEINHTVLAPGMVKSHYSPAKPMYLSTHIPAHARNRADAGLISFSGKDTEGYKAVLRLTHSNDLFEYAVNLFAALHQMEEADVDYFVAETVPEKGIGLAIMDRLKKAAYRYKQ